MNTSISEKITAHFSSMAIYRDPMQTDSLFKGRNLPSFVKDYVLKKYINENGQIDTGALTDFLDMVIPKKAEIVKDKLEQGEQLTLLTRFIIYIDLVKGIRRFAIPDLGIKLNEGQIPEYVYSQHTGELVDGENGALSSYVCCLMKMENTIMLKWLNLSHLNPISLLILIILEKHVKSFLRKNGWI